jgi:hypothetical protein
MITEVNKIRTLDIASSPLVYRVMTPSFSTKSVRQPLAGASKMQTITPSRSETMLLEAAFGSKWRRPMELPQF